MPLRWLRHDGHVPIRSHREAHRVIQMDSTVVSKNREMLDDEVIAF